MAVRTDRAEETRQRLLRAAERLFAERGLQSVSNRQIGEAAGQGNTAAVGYHFGTKADLVRAIVRRHTEPVERVRAVMVGRAEGSADAREWVGCLVHPVTEHLAELGEPTWYARFSAQALLDPQTREIMIDEALSSPSLVRALDGLNACLPDMPSAVRAERNHLTTYLMTQFLAERERAVAEGLPTPRRTWRGAATGLADAIFAIWTAPVRLDVED